jgi:ATP-dependent RNA helicase DHX57
VSIYAKYHHIVGLGGMAQGPCGEEFKAAFSCFVYSEAEPKGLDCVEKFKGMQDCFRLHPDVYGDEIDDDDEEEEEEQVKEEVKEETQEETVVASSPYEEEESNNTFSSWVSSWF